MFFFQGVPPDKNVWFHTVVINLPIVKGVYWVDVLIEMDPSTTHIVQLQDFKAEGCLQGELMLNIFSYN